MKCPCKGCDHRKLGCHGRCDEYQKWSAWKIGINQKRHEDKEVRQLSRDHELKYRKNLKTGVYK